MNLLIDTNIALEIILEQEKAEEARNLLTRVNEHNFFITDFSIHSIGIILFYKNLKTGFQNFLSDILGPIDMEIKKLSLEDMQNGIELSGRFNLDFDDAYQYQVAENMTSPSSASTPTSTERLAAEKRPGKF